MWQSIVGILLKIELAPRIGEDGRNRRRLGVPGSPRNRGQPKMIKQGSVHFVKRLQPQPQNYRTPIISPHLSSGVKCEGGKSFVSAFS
jgi:hypothetical protein